MSSQRCKELHEVHRAIATRRSRQFTGPTHEVSRSILRKDATWSSIIELECVEADGKTAINAHYGVRNDDLERRLPSSTLHSPSISTFRAINPEIEVGRFEERLNAIVDELDMALGRLDSTKALLDAIKHQGGSTLVFGSWKHNQSFPTGLTGKEIEKAWLE